MEKIVLEKVKNKAIPTSTVGRGRTVQKIESSELKKDAWKNKNISVFCGDSLEQYKKWDQPTVIVSDGGYGVLGFQGDTSDHLGLPDWYEPHVAAWSLYATPQTTLWFWNSEIGWAAVHPILEKYGWRYMNANIWNKGKGHIAGNVNTAKIRRFPVVTEVCVQYVFEARINGLELKKWLLQEWKRSGLPLRRANEACGVADAAVRKYLDQGHLWYYPPPEMFLKMQEFANKHGKPAEKPYFSIDGVTAGMANQLSMSRNLALMPALRARSIMGSISSVDLVTASWRRRAPHDLLSRSLETSWYRCFLSAEERSTKSRGNRVDPSDQAKVSNLKPLRNRPVVWS